MIGTTSLTALSTDYAERVYAGVLGKLIGIYLGRPVEGWTFEQIEDTFGEMDRYVPDPLGAPLIVTDDDLSGTFTFLRALPDHDHDPHLSAEQIGQTWLNYIIYQRTIVWFGGIGDSTEHTAYHRLRQGIPAPASGSIALNGKSVAEQIGAQIFIDGWGMLCPGDPERASDFARRAASVSHDGEAIYGAQVIAAMIAHAFVERDMNRLLDTAVSFIPPDATIARIVANVRDWHAAEPDWRRTRERIYATYPRELYGGNCHVVPNHALIMLGLLYGDDDFQKSLMIVNTAGFDTDCNSGNTGAILGVKNGLAGIDDSAYDWRGPVADRLYLPTADGGRAITDAVRESFEIVNMGRALAGAEPLAPKAAARFHFSLPGAVQGFTAIDPDVTVENVASSSATDGRALAVHWPADRTGDLVQVMTATFTPPEAINMLFYPLLASPTLYPGQEVRSRVVADPDNTAPVAVSIVIRSYGEHDAVETRSGPPARLAPGHEGILTWTVPDLDGAPICEVGIACQPESSQEGTVYLDWLTWDGAPNVMLGRPDRPGAMWRRAWVDGVDRLESRPGTPYRISQDYGTGVLSQGTADWQDYRVSADVSIVLARNGGIAARVTGLRRWYGLLLCDDGVARLVRCRDTQKTLAEAPFRLELDCTYHLALTVRGQVIDGEIDGEPLLSAIDTESPLAGGGAGLLVTEGTLSAGPVQVKPGH